MLLRSERREGAQQIDSRGECDLFAQRTEGRRRLLSDSDRQTPPPPPSNFCEPNNVRWESATPLSDRTEMAHPREKFLLGFSSSNPKDA